MAKVGDEQQGVDPEEELGTPEKDEDEAEEVVGDEDAGEGEDGDDDGQASGEESEEGAEDEEEDEEEEEEEDDDSEGDAESVNLDGGSVRYFSSSPYER